MLSACSTMPSQQKKSKQYSSSNKEYSNKESAQIRNAPPEEGENATDDVSTRQQEVLNNPKSLEASSPLQVELTDKVGLITRG